MSASFSYWPGRSSRAQQSWSPHGLEEQHRRGALRACACGHEEVRCGRVDRITVVRRHEAPDARWRGGGGPGRSPLYPLTDDHELALRHLPAARSRPEPLAVVRTPALLLDRRLALAVQEPERHVGLARSRLRRGRKPHGIVTSPKLIAPSPSRSHGQKSSRDVCSSSHVPDPCNISVVNTGQRDDREAWRTPLRSVPIRRLAEGDGDG